MKIALTTEGRENNSKISPIYGRCPVIIIFEWDNNRISDYIVMDNPVRFEKGAGNLLSAFLVNQEIDILISLEMGPIAFYILQKAGITIYKGSPLDVENNLKLLKKGNLREVTSIASGYPK